MCSCNLFAAEISSDGIIITCECWAVPGDAELLATLKLVGEYLER